MVYIKQIELSHFKSFGGTTQVPLLPGFTVVSGPNGSGKSNILDALLFALGLSSSKGMRAERLPDLVNQSHVSRHRSTVEASVTVTFNLENESLLRESDEDEDIPIEAEDLADFLDDRESPAHPDPPPDPSSVSPEATTAISLAPNEWTVTRRLRVTAQGTYTSTYTINGQPCTLTELHEQLHKLRIYPEGYNVVLQGDVTNIISMNGRDRREIIDELAGVATFDRKIQQAKGKLDAVREREDRCRIVERELEQSRDRLAQDRIKAEKYQKLRAELQTKERWEVVITYRHSLAQVEQLKKQIEADDRMIAQLTEQLTTLQTTIQEKSEQLEHLNARVKALGEEELLAQQATLATREAEQRQIQRQAQELQAAQQSLTQQLIRIQAEIQEHQEALTALGMEEQAIGINLDQLSQDRDQARQRVERSREAASEIASQSEAWVQEQTQLHRRLEELQHSFAATQSEQALLQERVSRLEQQRQQQQPTLQELEQEIAQHRSQQLALETQQTQLEEQVRALALALTATEQELQIQQETQARLLREQREKQRQLDKLEAQTQAMNESQGTYATQLLLQTGLPGICGLVAQLGRVEPQYQLALEIAAGGRLGQLVVEDDTVAAAAIELLKQRQAGRATFLPLNKINPGRMNLQPLRGNGFIDYAIRLIDYEARYADVFAYVFGQTAVFRTLADARPHLGQVRMVTLEGELLEMSGAMTGGSLKKSAGSLHFGNVDPAESAELVSLRERLREIDRILERGNREVERLSAIAQERSQSLTESRQQQREAQIQNNQLKATLQRLETQAQQLQQQLSQSQDALATALPRLRQLEADQPAQDRQLQDLRQQLAELEQSQTHSEWQRLQVTIKQQEGELQQRELAVRSAEQRLQDLALQTQRLQTKLQQGQQRQQEIRDQQTQQVNQQAAIQTQLTTIAQQIDQIRTSLATLEQTLGAQRQERDRVERQLREQQTQGQQLDWQRQKQQESRQTHQTTLAELEAHLTTQASELPDPLPEIPEDIGLEQLQQDLRSLQRRIQAMEPVNMLALEEYDRVQTRLEELSQKLATLESERTELLLRVENFTTLRQRAFQEAFDAVNENFQGIFAELSQGDGYLQLDDPQDPFNSGLNLIAHPKGKPVRRLASMSGGEKSLTALSFIFALQRYRPSPFYAFDEVDMFLDGANVERLAKMIRQQAQQAQFIVVSLRRPMIESAERTIGVTQARGAYTQVLGINLHSQSLAPSS